MTDTWDSVARFVACVLLNALWQVALIGAVVFALLWLGRIRSPQWRYGICLTALAAILACPLATALAPTGYRLFDAGRRSARPAVPGPQSVPAGDRSAVDVREAVPAALEVESVAAAAPSASFRTPAISKTRRVEVPPLVSSMMVSNGGEDAGVGPSGSLRWLLLLYIVGVAAMLGRLGLAQTRLLHLRLTARPAPREMVDLLEGLKKYAGVARRVQILVSDRIVLPVLIGILRPVILVPGNMANISALDLEVVILHELAHIRRLDPIVNLLQRMAEAVLFFHPVVWLIGRELRRQREYCCDAWVVGRTENEVEYARCLTELARQAVSHRAMAAAMAMAEPRHEVPRRVMAVLDGSSRSARALPGWTLGLMFVVALSAAAVLGVLSPATTAEARDAGQSYVSRPLQAVNDARRLQESGQSGQQSVFSAYGSPAKAVSRPNPQTAPMPAGPIAPVAGMAALPQATPVEPSDEDRILVLTGERVTCHVMGTLLDDVHYEHRPASDKPGFRDDGANGDVQAEDNIWTNYVERSDVLSPEADRLLQRYQNMLDLVDRANPIDFFGAVAASDDPRSRLARTADQEKARDEMFLRRWNEKFLAGFRRNPNDPAGEYFPVFVPRPPRQPESPAPPGDLFSPSAYAVNDFTRRTAGGMAAATGITSRTARRLEAERIRVVAAVPESSMDDPVDFIYLSKQFVFDVFVAAAALNTPGVRFDPAAQDSPDRPLEAFSTDKSTELENLLELGRDLPGWQRVGRVPLRSSDREQIERAIADVYAAAFRVLSPAGPNPARLPSPYAAQPSYYDDDSNRSLVGVRPQPAVAPVDPVAFGEWFFHYQQMIAWERYVREKVLALEQDESVDLYDLETVMSPADLYLIPPPPNAPLPLIHFDGLIGEVGGYLSAVRPKSARTALDQMYDAMLRAAERKADGATDRTRRLVARLDQRQRARHGRVEWYNEKTDRLRSFAQEFRRRHNGDRPVVDGVQVLVSRRGTPPAPLGLNGIATERITPYDLLNPDGTLKPSLEQLR